MINFGDNLCVGLQNVVAKPRFNEVIAIPSTVISPFFEVINDFFETDNLEKQDISIISKKLELANKNIKRAFLD